MRVVMNKELEEIKSTSDVTTLPTRGVFADLIVPISNSGGNRVEVSATMFSFPGTCSTV